MGSETLQPCENRECRRKTGGAGYCCTPCMQADDGKYEIDEHTPGCTQRHEARQRGEDPWL